MQCCKHQGNRLRNAVPFVLHIQKQVVLLSLHPAVTCKIKCGKQKASELDRVFWSQELGTLRERNADVTTVRLLTGQPCLHCVLRSCPGHVSLCAKEKFTRFSWGKDSWKWVPGTPHLSGTQLLTHKSEEVPACKRGYSASMVLEVGHRFLKRDTFYSWKNSPCIINSGLALYHCTATVNL